MSEPGRISVIVPAYNAAETIGAALDSALGQTYAPYEIIVIDDGSTDDTARVLARYRDRLVYLKQANSGPAAARNRGLERARGDLIAFLDADDLFPRDALRAMGEMLEEQPEIEIVQGHVQDVWANEGEWVRGEPRLSFQLGSALFRRRAIERIGRFLESLRQGEDTDFWLRTREEGLSRRVIPDVTYWYRRQAVNGLRDDQTYRASLVGAVKRSLDRTRGSAK